MTAEQTTDWTKSDLLLKRNGEKNFLSEYSARLTLKDGKQLKVLIQINQYDNPGESFINIPLVSQNIISREMAEFNTIVLGKKGDLRKVVEEILNIPWNNNSAEVSGSSYFDSMDKNGDYYEIYLTTKLRQETRYKEGLSNPQKVTILASLLENKTGFILTPTP